MLAEITPGLFSQVTCFTIVPVAQCDNCNLDEVLLMQDTPQYITAGQVDMYIKTTNIYENIRLKERFVLIYGMEILPLKNYSILVYIFSNTFSYLGCLTPLHDLSQLWSRWVFCDPNWISLNVGIIVPYTRKYSVFSVMVCKGISAQSSRLIKRS